MRNNTKPNFRVVESSIFFTNIVKKTSKVIQDFLRKVREQDNRLQTIIFIFILIFSITGLIVIQHIFIAEKLPNDNADYASLIIHYINILFSCFAGLAFVSIGLRTNKLINEENVKRKENDNSFVSTFFLAGALIIWIIVDFIGLYNILNVPSQWIGSLELTFILSLLSTLNSGMFLGAMLGFDYKKKPRWKDWVVYKKLASTSKEIKVLILFFLLLEIILFFFTTKLLPFALFDNAFSIAAISGTDFILSFITISLLGFHLYSAFSERGVEELNFLLFITLSLVFVYHLCNQFVSLIEPAHSSMLIMRALYKVLLISIFLFLQFTWVDFFVGERLKESGKSIKFLNDYAIKLSKLVNEASESKEELNLVMSNFLAKVVKESYDLANDSSETLKTDVFYIGLTDFKNNKIDVYYLERGKDLELIEIDLQTNKGLICKILNDDNILNEKKGLTRKFNNAKEIRNYAKAICNNEIPPSSVLISTFSEGRGVVSVQAYKKGAYLKTKDDFKYIAKTISENLSGAIKQLKTIIKLKKEKAHVSLLQREVSHRLKNHLLAFEVTINGQIKEQDHKGNLNAVQILEKTKRKLKAISLVHHQLDQKGDEEDQKYLAPHKYFSDLTDYLLKDSFGYQAEQIDLDIEDLKKLKPLHFEFVKDIGAVLTEIVLNIFEHAYKEIPIKSHYIKIRAVLDYDSGLELIFEDKGVGMTQEDFEESRRTGSKLIKNTIRKDFGGDIIIGPSSLSGTKTTIQIPIYKNQYL